MEQEHIQIGEIELPINYFTLSQEEKDYVCNGLMEVMIELLQRETPVYMDRIHLLDKMFESSIITNLDMENYEIVAILEDARKKING